jgi:hypothetical protein
MSAIMGIFVFQSGDKSLLPTTTLPSNRSSCSDFGAHQAAGPPVPALHQGPPFPVAPWPGRRAPQYQFWFRASPGIEEQQGNIEEPKWP